MVSNSDVTVLIPAYNPDEKLTTLIEEIIKEGFQQILVVNDGSKADCQSIFSKIKEREECILLEHDVNRGKGQALKTAFTYFLEECPGSVGVVTLDADGQHAVEDMKRVANKLTERPRNLVLGVRDFSGEDIPFRSKFGNVLTKNIARLACGVKISDTQTGLRGIPAHFIKKLLGVTGQRYEFEMNMLMECKSNQIEIEEVKIRTIYLEENKSSHFKPIRDSVRIYTVFLKFILSSVLSFGVDILLFALFIMMLNGIFVESYILLATIVSRVLSSLFNYTLNRKVVFQSHSSHALIKYFSLSVAQMLASAGGVYIFFELIGFGEVGIKVVVDGLLFLVSYVIQREWVFKKKYAYRAEQ
ncbi:bifunctional glycosyltransferase family 2/GtrA family protein [Sutcliffiella horikoshii]|uniref:bifunctional glycosyltransferase family 2/GtrA family protein n=1 Tax=Sutcliffiella horikoshii TaxID=79883 RepID=UPI001F2EC252|nr:bifunctional glycosyltransferase family 2/GtrA family protein [Sutcliffiella horikoshii]MCG1021535.1 glycosyltransferase [Sutcliffiella horikoshii]